jgi:phosphoglycerol transferase
LYGLIPFGFFRNVGHLNLAHFMVPAGAYLGVSLARVEVFRLVRQKRTERTNYRDWRRFILTLGICAAIGLSYIYWAFFTCIIVFLGCVIGYCRSKNVNVPLSACIYLGIIGLAAGGNVSPTLLYWQRNGPNLEAQSKVPAQADEYALRIRQMLTPISTHPLRFMRSIRDKILAAGFPFDRNESFTATLGTIGSLGFLLLLWAAIAPAPGTLLCHRTVRVLAGMAIGVIVVATEGGFGSLFSVFVSHEIRGYNRISPFISLFSFAALGVASDRFLRTVAHVPRFMILGGIVCLGMFDQVPLDILTGHEAAQVQFRKDRDYIRQLETKFPSGAMIFQLPHTNFPLDVAPNKMVSYDNAKAYLHSKALRWTWGNIMGRHDNWARSTAQLPVDQFLKRIVFVGFEGILLDRNGFSDGKLEEELSKKLGAGTKFESGFRWVFFDLRPFRKNLETTLSPGEWERERQTAGLPTSTKIEWRGGFSTLETSKENSWRWCSKTGIIRFSNDSDAAKVIDVSGQVFVYGATPYPLSIQRDGQRQQLQVSQEPAVYHDRFVLAAHTSADISFDYGGPLLEVPTDPRQLAFQLQNFQWYDEEPNKAAPANQ